jgi:hypothetical protein
MTVFSGNGSEMPDWSVHNQRSRKRRIHSPDQGRATREVSCSCAAHAWSAPELAGSARTACNRSAGVSHNNEINY